MRVVKHECELHKKRLRAGCIVIAYMLIWFYSGAALYGKIEGSWRGVDCSNDYTFTAEEYIHGAKSGSYRIKGNKIILSSGKEFYISIKDDCLIIDGDFYLKNIKSCELKVLETVLFLERRRTKKNFSAKLRFTKRINLVDFHKKA